MTAPFFFEGETAGLTFVQHRCPQSWWAFSPFAREDAAANYPRNHAAKKHPKLCLLHRGVLDGPAPLSVIIARTAHRVWRICSWPIDGVGAITPVPLIQILGNLFEQLPLPLINTAQEFGQFAIARTFPTFIIGDIKPLAHHLIRRNKYTLLIVGSDAGPSVALKGDTAVSNYTLVIRSFLFCQHPHFAFVTLPDFDERSFPAKIWPGNASARTITASPTLSLPVIVACMLVHFDPAISGPGSFKSTVTSLMLKSVRLRDPGEGSRAGWTSGAMAATFTACRSLRTDSGTIARAGKAMGRR